MAGCQMGLGMPKILPIEKTKFIQETYHEALVAGKDEAHSRITCWYLTLEPFKFEVHNNLGK